MGLTMSEWSLRVVVGEGKKITLFCKHVAFGRMGVWTAGVRKRMDIASFLLLKLHNGTRWWKSTSQGLK